jgi:hypothetical protein
MQVGMALSADWKRPERSVIIYHLLPRLREDGRNVSKRINPGHIRSNNQRMNIMRSFVSLH